MNLVEPAIMVILFVIAVIGGLIAYELRRIHGRIDKYSAEMDDHVKAGVEVHKSLERIETTQRLHIENAHAHRRD